jgi:hypothetical protein
MFLLDIQQRSPWNGDTTIIQTHLQKGMARSVFSGSVMVQFANRFHLLGSLEGLSVIDDEEQVFIFLGEQTTQHVQGNLLHYGRLIPVTPPEKFTVIGAMSTVPQQLDEPINRTAMTDTYRQYHRPEIAVYMFGNLFLDRLEKTMQSLGNFADCNHMASPAITTFYYKSYRLSRPFLFDVFSNHHFNNRSV